MQYISCELLNKQTMPKRKRGGPISKYQSSGVTNKMRRRVFKRRRGRRNPVRVQGTHTFSRRADAVTETINGLFLARLYTANFNTMVQSSDFTAMFDQYRITKITYTFQLVTNPDAYLVTNVQNAFNPTNWYPKMWWCVDQDGGPTETISSMKERQGVKCVILRPNKTVKISHVPMCRTLTYSTPTSTGYSPRNIKIDMSDTSVEHYGLQVVFDTNGIDPNDLYPFRVIMERKFHFSCYGVR